MALDESNPGEGYEVMSCPLRLPHDLEEGQKIARWFGPPYNEWFIGKVMEINKKRTKSENVTVEYTDKRWGKTWSNFLADKEYLRV